MSLPILYVLWLEERATAILVCCIFAHSLTKFQSRKFQFTNVSITWYKPLAAAVPVHDDISTDSQWVSQSLLLLYYTYFSMTTLLIQTVPQFTKHSFRPKTNNHPIKMFSSLAGSWVNVHRNWMPFYKWFQDWSFQKISITKNVLLKWHSSMKNV